MFGVSRKFHGGERERERESDEGEWLLLYPGDDDKVAWSQGDAL